MKRLSAYFSEAVHALWANRLRSALSMLGMVIGIASVIGVLGLSQAASNGIAHQLSSGGSPGYMVQVDESQNDPSVATLTKRDAQRFADLSGGTILQAIPGYYARGFKLKSGARTIRVGVTGLFPARDLSGLELVGGRLLSDDDQAAAGHVVILSGEAARHLYDGANPVGRTVNIGARRFRIVGVFTVAGSLVAQAVGDSAYIPLSVMEELSPQSIDYIQFWSTPDTSPQSAIDAAKNVLAHIHGERAQYRISDRQAALGRFARSLSIVGVGLTIIGAIALFVAGIGIMNIMYVSVVERTREIGVRRAVGARSADIRLQFLIESILLAIGGGGLGAVFGILFVAIGARVISGYFGAAPVPWGAVISVACGFSIGVGVCFGYYPARQASFLDPIEALRT